MASRDVETLTRQEVVRAAKSFKLTRKMTKWTVIVDGRELPARLLLLYSAGVALPGIAPVEVNIAKPSFRKNCPHLIGKRIGLWMQTAGYAPWPDRKPPKFDVEPAGDRCFRIVYRL